MKLRLSRQDDLPDAWQIIEDAKKYFKNNDIPQWQNGSPTLQTLQDDWKKKQSYVLEEDGEIVGTCAILFQEEPAYERIYQGRWLNNSEYATIHRLAIKKSYKGHGYGSVLLQQAQRIVKAHGVDNLRIDTHRLNHSMQRLIAKNNFTYCGLIYLDEAKQMERLAYQKEI